MHKDTKHTVYDSLAQFVSTEREKLGLSQSGLAKKCNLTLAEIGSIESGIEVFLSTTVRQKLAKGLKVARHDIKRYEKGESFTLGSAKEIEEIKEQILLNGEFSKTALYCPVCGERLITRIAKMYDLEDNLMLHPKAKCSRCPFQIS